MANYPYELEKGPKKIACPGCGRKSFKRVIETSSGNRLPDYVGRCDHESSCGYEYTWKQYFSDNPDERHEQDRHFKNGKERRKVKPGSDGKSGLQGNYEGRFSSKKPDYLLIDHMLETLTGYDQNAFVQFLLGLFPFDPEDVWRAVTEYMIGTKRGYCVFPTITKTGKVCKGKLIKFHRETGKRLKPEEDQYSTSSLEHFLKREGMISTNFDTDKEVFFGEHLLSKYSDLPIAIVESEKSAVIGSICKAVFPDMVWLACGSGGWLKAQRLKRFGEDRIIWLFPDADQKSYWFTKWQSIACDARKTGLTVIVSDLIEKHATDAERAKGFDLADYLIREQAKRNDPSIREEFRVLIEERVAIMTIDGRMAEEQAEAEIESSGFYQNAIRAVLNPTESKNLGLIPKMNVS